VILIRVILTVLIMTGLFSSNKTELVLRGGLT